MTTDKEIGHPGIEDGAIEHEDDIDWQQIVDDTESDYRRRRFAFNSADCATDEEATVALRDWIHSVFEVGEEHVADDDSVHAER